VRHLRPLLSYKLICRLLRRWSRKMSEHQVKIREDYVLVPRALWERQTRLIKKAYDLLEKLDKITREDEKDGRY
jgi:hypothetical protein